MHFGINVQMQLRSRLAVGAARLKLGSVGHDDGDFMVIGVQIVFHLLYFPSGTEHAPVAGLVKKQPDRKSLGLQSGFSGRVLLENRTQKCKLYYQASYRKVKSHMSDFATFYCKIAPNNPHHAGYHDKEYGFPAMDERVLFERLSLEIMQAGLSWDTIIRKRKALNKAFDNFRVSKVAAYGAKDIKRLLADRDIIRNRLKIEAIIFNAKAILAMRKSHGGFAKWLAAHHPRTEAEWVKLFRKTFKFTGGIITAEFLMSIGYLPGAHRSHCPVYKAILRKKPAWTKGALKNFLL